LPREVEPFTGPAAWRPVHRSLGEVGSFTRDFRANEKFHLSPAFSGTDQLRNTENQLQSLLYAISLDYEKSPGAKLQRGFAIELVSSGGKPGLAVPGNSRTQGAKRTLKGFPHLWSFVLPGTKGKETNLPPPTRLPPVRARA
jgi:hypothetical protein